MGNFSEAESSFRKAISGNPTSTVPWIYLASALAQQEKFEDVIAVLRGAEGLDGDQDEVCLNLAYSHRTLGHLAEARAYLLPALTISPDYDEAREALDDIVAALVASSV